MKLSAKKIVFLAGTIFDEFVVIFIVLVKIPPSSERNADVVVVYDVRLLSDVHVFLTLDQLCTQTCVRLLILISLSLSLAR